MYLLINYLINYRLLLSIQYNGTLNTIERDISRIFTFSIYIRCIHDCFNNYVQLACIVKY